MSNAAQDVPKSPFATVSKNKKPGYCDLKLGGVIIWHRVACDIPLSQKGTSPENCRREGSRTHRLRQGEGMRKGVEDEEEETNVPRLR